MPVVNWHKSLPSTIQAFFNLTSLLTFHPTSLLSPCHSVPKSPFPPSLPWPLPQVSESEPLLLSWLISICNDGRLSRRLFFILCVCCSFCLIMAPHTFWRAESSSSSTSSPPFFTPTLEATDPDLRLGAFPSRGPSLWEGPSLLHRRPVQMRWGRQSETLWANWLLIYERKWNRITINMKD